MRALIISLVAVGLLAAAASSVVQRTKYLSDNQTLTKGAVLIDTIIVPDNASKIIYYGFGTIVAGDSLPVVYFRALRRGKLFRVRNPYTLDTLAAYIDTTNGTALRAWCGINIEALEADSIVAYLLSRDSADAESLKAVYTEIRYVEDR